MTQLATTQFPALPAHLQRRALARKDTPPGFLLPGGNQPARISIEGNRFTLIASDGEEMALRTLDLTMVIVGENPNMSRMYYPNAYDPKAVEYSPPDCFSDNGIGASTQASNPQSTSCTACEWAVWGSALSNVTGKKKPACQTSKKLAVLVDGKLYRFSVTPGSFGNWQTYVRFLRSAGSEPLLPTDVVTSVEFEGTGVLKFKPKAYVSEADAQLQDSFYDEHTSEYEELLGLNDKPIEVLPPKGGSVVRPEPQQRPAPQQRTPEKPKEEPLGFGSFEQTAAPAPEQTKAAAPRKPRAPAATAKEEPQEAPSDLLGSLDEAFDMPLNGYRK